MVTFKSQTGYYKDTFDLNVTVDDANLNSSSVGYLVDGTNFTFFPSPPDFPDPGPVDFAVKIDLSGFTEADHTITIRASDDAGNVNDQTSITFRVDRTAPTMDIPFEGGYVTGEITITVTIIIISDDEAPVVESSVTYTIDTGPHVPFVKIGEFTFEAVIDTGVSSITEGPHTLRVYSMDAAGNEGVRTWEIIVDKHIPEVSMGDFFWFDFGSVRMQSPVSDTHLDTGSVAFELDEGGWKPCYQENPSPHCAVEIDGSTITPGIEHHLCITARDKAGNEKTLNITFSKPKRPGPCKDCVANIERNGDVTLDWMDSSDPISHYRVYVSRDADIATNFGATAPTATTTESQYNVGSLAPGKTYILIIPVGDEMFGDPCFAEIDYPIEDYGRITVGEPVLDDDKPTDDDNIVISVPVENTGKIPLRVTVRVLLNDGEYMSKTVTIEGDGTTVVTFTLPPQPAGDYDIDLVFERPPRDPHGTPEKIDEKTTYVHVSSADPPEPPSNPLLDNPIVERAAADMTCCLIFIIIIALIIVGLYVGIRKARRRPGEVSIERPRYPSKPAKKHYPKRPQTREYPHAPPSDTTPATQTSTSVPTQTTPSTTPDPSTSAVTTEDPTAWLAGPTAPRDETPPEILDPSGGGEASDGSVPETPMVSQPESPPVGAPETVTTSQPETPPSTVTETRSPVEPTTPPVTETPPERTSTVTRSGTGTADMPGGVPPIVPTVAVPSERKGPCDGIKEQWDAMKIDAERRKKEAEAAEADVPVKKKEAEDKRKDATEARKEAEEKRKPMDEKEEALRKREAQRDQLVKTIINTIDGASTTPVDGWEQYTGADGSRGNLVPGRIYLAPGNAAVEDYVETIKKWEDQLAAAKKKEADAREEFEKAKKEFDDANEEANKKEAEADAAEVAHKQAERNAETKRNEANAAIDKANKFADEWRQCIKERLNRLVKRTEAYANQADRAAGKRPSNPEEAEMACDGAEEAADSAKEARDQLERETKDIDDPELGDDIREATRRADDAYRRANNTRTRARRWKKSMPRQCQDGERKKGRRYTKRRRYLDEDADILVDYDPMYGPDEDGKLTNQELAEGMAKCFEAIGKASGKAGKVIPKGGEHVKVPLKFIDFYMKAGTAIIKKSIEIFDEHYKRLGFGTLTVKVPVIRITETWEKQYVCEHGMWVREGDVKIDEKMDHGYEQRKRPNVPWKDIPWWVGRMVSTIPRK
jgi:hypothetical protein